MFAGVCFPFPKFQKGAVMKTVRTRKVSSLFALCFVLMAQAVFAQNDAGAKIRGDAWNGGQVQTHQRHAQDRSQMLYYYTPPHRSFSIPVAAPT